jgi:glycosyltransferase involved in cell wall biosynthesis
MKILYVDQFSEIGGAQKCMLDLLPAIQARGWQMHAALPGGGPLVSRLHSAGVEVERIECGPYRSGRKSILDVARFAMDHHKQTSTIARLTSRHEFDLVYVNGPRVLPGIAKAVGAGIPILFHAHNHVHGYSRRLLGSYLATGNALTVACCQSVASCLRPLVAPDRIQVIPTGTPVLPFRARQLEPRRGFRIGMVGSIQPEKGQAEFLKSVDLILGSLPNTQFVIYGIAPPSRSAYFNRLQKLARGLPVEFRGWCDNIGHALNDMDLLVIASKLEGLPRVLLEAFSTGLPVIAFPKGGITEAIEDNVTGFLVSEPSSKSLAERVIKLAVDDRHLLSAAAVAARSRWEQEYDLKLYTQRLMRLMERVASEKQRQPVGK